MTNPDLSIIFRGEPFERLGTAAMATPPGFRSSDHVDDLRNPIDAVQGVAA